MSRAEELADALMMQAKTLRLAGQNDSAVVDIEAAAAELRRLSAVEAGLEAEREESKRWRNVATWEKEIRQQAEKIANKSVTELEALKKAIGDAEPVAWLSIGIVSKLPQAVAFSEQDVLAMSTNCVVVPLTIKGIK